MKMSGKKSIISLIFLLLCFAVVSCGEDNVTGTQSEINPSYTDIWHTPYADKSELEGINQSGDGYVDWRVARTFALINFELYRDENRWYGAHISKKPVVVYDGNGKPKYYEFRVVLTNKDYYEIGSITTVAQKKMGGPIAYILPTPKYYGNIKTKSPGHKIISCNYPNFGYGVVTKAGPKIPIVVDNNGNDADADIDATDEDIQNYVEQNKEDFELKGLSQEDAVAKIKQDMQDKKQMSLEMWNSVENIKSNFVKLSTNDEFFRSISRSSTKSWTNYVSSYIDHPIKNDQAWYDPSVLRSRLHLHWSPYKAGWCGPAVVSMIATKYGNTDKVEVRRDANGNVTYDGNYIVGTLMGIRDWNHGGTGGSDVRNALEWSTGLNYDRYWPWWHRNSTIWNKIKGNIRAGDPFALSRGGWQGSAGHWRIGMGYQEANVYDRISEWHCSVRWKGWFIFWYPVFTWYKVQATKHIGQDRWILITDNGAESKYNPDNGGNPGERHYWSQYSSLYCDNVFFESLTTSDYSTQNFARTWVFRD